MAEEKIKLFELDIDTDKAVDDLIKLRKEVENYKILAKSAKENQGELSAEYVDYSTKLKAAQAEMRTQKKLLQNVHQSGRL